LLFQHRIDAASVHFSGRAFRDPDKFEIERDTDETVQEYYNELTGTSPTTIFRVRIFRKNAIGNEKNEDIRLVLLSERIILAQPTAS